MSEFISWRKQFLGRDTTREQQMLVRALDHCAAQDDAATVVLNSTPGIGQTSVILDWSTWKVRTDPGAQIVVVAHHATAKVAAGLLPSERTRLSFRDKLDAADEGALVIVDGAAMLPKATAA